MESINFSFTGFEHEAPISMPDFCCSSLNLHHDAQKPLLKQNKNLYIIPASTNVIAREDSQSRGFDVMYAIFNAMLIFILNCNIKLPTWKDFWVKYFTWESYKCSSKCFLFLQFIVIMCTYCLWKISAPSLWTYFNIVIDSQICDFFPKKKDLKKEIFWG